MVKGLKFCHKTAGGTNLLTLTKFLVIEGTESKFLRGGEILGLEGEGKLEEPTETIGKLWPLNHYP